VGVGLEADQTRTGGNQQGHGRQKQHQGRVQTARPQSQHQVGRKRVQHLAGRNRQEGQAGRVRGRQEQAGLDPGRVDPGVLHRTLGLEEWRTKKQYEYPVGGPGQQHQPGQLALGERQDQRAGGAARPLGGATRVLEQEETHCAGARKRRSSAQRSESAQLRHVQRQQKQSQQTQLQCHRTHARRLYCTPQQSTH